MRVFFYQKSIFFFFYLLFLGPKFSTIIDQWEEENRKAVLLGGHDISIWNCIFALGFDQPENIDFISSIIFEMHSMKNYTSEEIFVKVNV